MKFGHAFLEALAADSYPPHWVDKAIPYRQLKKILGKVRAELIKNGYHPDTLHRLVADRDAEYRFETDASHLLRPELFVRPRVSTSTSVSPEPEVEPRSLADVELASPAPDDADATSVPEQDISEERNDLDDDDDDDDWVKIPLNADVLFFSVLQTDVTELDTLQDEERHLMNDKIRLLGSEIAEVAKPRKGLMTKFSKSDLYRWREIFELYVAAQVFFSTNEAAGGLRKSEKARKQLVWFQDEVNKRQLPQKFKIQSSATAYTQFLALNARLLQNLQFQELNQTAVTKIIKSEWEDFFDTQPVLI
jgi:hypothetical protein